MGSRPKAPQKSRRLVKTEMGKRVSRYPLDPEEALTVLFQVNSNREPVEHDRQAE
jgi:hypothetical protein